VAGLANFESGADNKLAQLTDRMLRTHELKARITKEVMPPARPRLQRRPIAKPRRR
jgi:hypothetical protein